MRNYSILILMIVAIGILAIPVAADVAYGPDYGITLKNGSWVYENLDITSASYLNGTAVTVQAYELGIDQIRWNQTIAQFPNTISYPSIRMVNNTLFTAIPPAVDAKIKYYSTGTHVLTIHWIAYKQRDLGTGSHIVNLYGDFEYVNYAWLGSQGTDVDLTPTEMYNNISNAVLGKSYWGIIYHDNDNVNQFIESIGYGLVRGTATYGEPILWDSPYTVFTSQVVTIRNDYGIVNTAPDWSKKIDIFRNLGDYYDNSHLQVWNGTHIIYDSGEGTGNTSHYFYGTTGRFVLNDTIHSVEKTIFDDNYTVFTPPPPTENTWDLTVIVRDASTSGLYDGATVTKTDLTDPYYNGWGTTYSGRVTFQAITGHEYNFSASAVGYTTGYANYSAITPINPYVSIWIYPIGTPATGYGYLDFMVRDSVGNTLEQAQVHLTDGQTKYTLMGYTRFNVTASTVIGYSVMKENYNTVTGNITSTTGTLTIPIILYNTGEGPTPTPTLDRRTSQQKFIDAGAVFANNAELFASLIVMAVMISLIDKITLGSLSRAFGGRRKGK